MPVALIRTAPTRAYAPVPALEVHLGSALDCAFVDRAEGVAARHARLRYLKGEWMLTAADGERVWVNGESVPFITLQPDDEVQLAPEGHRWTFRNRLSDAFVPPGLSIARTWMAHPWFAAPEHGPRACRDKGWVVKRDLPCRRAEDVDTHLELLSRLGGAPHRSLARLVEGGLHPADDGVARWMAMRFVEGTVARDALAEHKLGLPPTAVVPALTALAAGLARLHLRGVIHRDIAPGNVVLTGDGASLIDFGHAVLADGPLSASAGVVGTPGYVAPEEVLEGPVNVTRAVDVYGLCAVGYALLTGSPPAGGEHVLDTLSRAARRAVAPSELGVELPEAFERSLLAGLDPDPTARPDAETLHASWAAVEHPLREGGPA